MSLRQEQDQADWPLRPWIMAAIASTAGLVFHLLIDFDLPAQADPIPAWKQAAATFVAIATVSFVLTVELRRLHWALIFAAGWGAVVAFVGWFTAQYNVHSTIFEWPFLSGIFAVLLAAPLFQTVRDEGAWSFPYERLHRHAWTDAVIGAASLFFTGVAFLLAWLIAGLFSLIGIDAVKDLLQEEWFGWMLAGFAFGAAVGLLRERDGLLVTLQRLVMVVFSVLAPVLAAALILFLASLPFTGLAKLWGSEVPTTPLLLVAGAGAILLANAVIGNGTEERSRSRLLRWSALALVAAVLPLAVLAAISMGIRIDQYGWTPERIWGVIAVGVAIAYGLAGWWSTYRRRGDFDDELRPLQTKMAIGLCGLALFLALPILDFGAISARSQMARLNSGEVTAEEFDWRAMAFDFGRAGRKHLSELAKAGPPERRQLAQAALKSEYRYDFDAVETAKADQELDQYLRRVPADLELTPELREALAESRYCRDLPCLLVRLDDDQVIVAGRMHERGPVVSQALTLKGGKWASDDPVLRAPAQDFQPNLGTADVEVRTVERRQLFIDGRPVGEAYE